MHDNVKTFLDKASKIDFRSNDELREFALTHANVFSGNAPSLNEHGYPNCELLDANDCPLSLNPAECNNCDYFVDIIADYPVFSHTVFDIVCTHK